jgi:hypothetical protein
MSIGVYAADPTDTGWESVFARADEAMYNAKNTGKNRICTRDGVPTHQWVTTEIDAPGLSKGIH